MSKSNLHATAPDLTSGALAQRISSERAKVFGAYGAVALASQELSSGSCVPVTEANTEAVDMVIGALDGAREALFSASNELSDLTAELQAGDDDAGTAISADQPKSWADRLQASYAATLNQASVLEIVRKAYEDSENPEDIHLIVTLNAVLKNLYVATNDMDQLSDDIRHARPVSTAEVAHG
jgi:hypothetical protein